MFSVLLLVRIHCGVFISIQSKILCIGNKCDIDQREVPNHVAEQFAKKNGMWYLETSAKNSENVGKLFQTIAEELTQKAKESSMALRNPSADGLNPGDLSSKPVKTNCCS